jgi:hypothetical protein
MKRAVLFCLITVLLLLNPLVNAYAAQSTTLTFAANRKGWWVRTQDAFLPDRNVTTLQLNRPESIAFCGNDILYVADRGNRRVLMYDVENDIVTGEIRHPGFVAPRGVFVARNGTLYVADSGAGAVFLFDGDGGWVRTLTRPVSPAFGDTPFAPYRVAADMRGNVYIVSEGVFNGIIQLSGAGEFLGFFASNRTTLTLTQILQDFFFTDRQREGLMDRLPLTFSNVFADGRGIVYSTTMGRENRGLNKHDMAGRDMFGDVWTFISTTDVTVDRNGIIYTADAGGFIGVYANDGSEIFFFGAVGRTEDDIAGMYSSLISIAVCSRGHIWTLDNEKAFLQSYTPTEYTLAVFRALSLFDGGHYDAAGHEWRNVLRYNQMSVLAHNGLGRSYLYRQDYGAAMLHFEVAGNREFYSQAFWETRNIWLLDNLTNVLAIAAALIIISSALKYADRQKRVKLAFAGAVNGITGHRYLKNVFFAFSVARRPLDSYYYMKRGEKGSTAGAAVMSALFFVSYMVYQTNKAFILQYQEIEDMDFNVIIGGFIGITALFIICNYLVTSINDGEGGAKDIFKVVSYASFPLSIMLLSVTALTYVITLNEVFLIHFAMAAGFVWSGAVLYLGLQEVHGYSVRETVKSILITIAFMLIAVIVLFNLFILFDQVSQFVEGLAREIYGNVRGLY